MLHRQHQQHQDANLIYINNTVMISQPVALYFAIAKRWQIMTNNNNCFCSVCMYTVVHVQRTSIIDLVSHACQLSACMLCLLNHVCNCFAFIHPCRQASFIHGTQSHDRNNFSAQSNKTTLYCVRYTRCTWTLFLIGI